MAKFNCLIMPELKFQTLGKHMISVYHTTNCDGGGKSFGTKYPSIINARYPGHTFDCCLDWCSGPGFIGYNLLDHEICRTLHLVDHYQPGIDCAKKTIDNLPIQFKDCVHAHQIDDLALLPKSQMFDLVVANPPHFPAKLSAKIKAMNTLACKGIYGGKKLCLDKTDMDIMPDHAINRLIVDQDWAAHKNFYHNIKSRLAPDGVILMQENAAGSSAEDFRSMIESAGLEITDVFFDEEYGNLMPSIKIYYIEIKHQE